MKTVSIIGFGRFGKTLYRLLKDDFRLVLYNRSTIDATTIDLSKNVTIAKSLADVYKSDVIFYAVPISTFEEVIKSHRQYIEDRHVLIDVLSVKIHPKTVFDTYLKDSKAHVLLTHPMFGPDSSKNGFAGLPIILDQYRSDDETYTFWKDFFRKKELKVIEMSAEEHDKTAADTQGLTHFVGRLLEEFDLKDTPIASVGTKKLLEIKEQTCNDTWQLFTDLQQYNPHTKQMRIRLGDAYDEVYNKLLPKQIHPDYITYGLQGGKGSFNEEALLYFLNRAGITNYKIKYLFTSLNVLNALHKGEIDRGQFAIHNSVGGIVDESIQPMARYKFEITEQFGIKIAHALMIRKDANFNEVTTIMSHPQVFAQCKKTLAEKYPQLQQTSGEGELIDHANVAKHLSEDKLPKNIATMGSKILADLYDLKIVEDNLQDAKDNYTSFLHVVRNS